MASILRLESVAECYSRAADRTEISARALAKQLSQILKHDLTPKRAASAALEFRRTRKNPGQGERGFQQLVERVRIGLRADNREDAEKALMALWGYRHAHAEHGEVVTQTVSLLEQLLRQLLFRMLDRNGTPIDRVSTPVRRKWNYKKCEERFKELAGVSLREAICFVESSAYYDDWNKIRDLRNKLLHQFPCCVGPDDAERAFEVGKNSFAVFATLHNKFCINGLLS
jgi:Rad3-related DNA helicase